MSFHKAILAQPFKEDEFLTEYNKLINIANIDETIDTIQSPLLNIIRDIDHSNKTIHENEKNKVFDQALLIGRVLTTLDFIHPSNTRIKPLIICALYSAQKSPNKEIRYQSALLLNNFLPKRYEVIRGEFPFKETFQEINRSTFTVPGFFYENQSNIDGLKKERAALWKMHKACALFTTVSMGIMIGLAFVATGITMGPVFITAGVSGIGWLVWFMVEKRMLNLNNTQVKKNITPSRDHLNIFNSPDFEASLLLDNIFENEKTSSEEKHSAPSSEFNEKISHRNIGPDAENLTDNITPNQHNKKR